MVLYYNIFSQLGQFGCYIMVCHILFVGILAPFELGGVIKRISPVYHIGFESYFTSFRRTVRYFQFIHKVRNTDKDNIAK